MKSAGRSLWIAAYSDLDRDPVRRRLWGDTWIKERLFGAFRAAGWRPDDRRPDLLLHLFGHPMTDLPRARVRILWIHSHPDRVDAALLRGYDRVFCVSRLFLQRLAALGRPDARHLMLPTHMEPLPRPLRHDVVFVGNARRDGRRRLVEDLLSVRARIRASVSIWGNGLEERLPKEWFRGREYPNEELNALYAAARVVLNDHHPDMARHGFPNPRILDALAAGALPVSDPVAGLEEFVRIPVYRDPGELAEKIAWCLEDEPRRRTLVEANRARLRPFRYDRAVETLEAAFSEALAGGAGC